MKDLGTLSPVSIREVWGKEDSDFTPWLADNADLLGEALGRKLVHVQTEAEVGRYSADLVFREKSTGKLVVVENMFGSTDHGHLGQLITYAAGLDARYVVLVAPDYREEHRSALNWLNTISAEDFAFFGVVLEAWRIGDSRPAPRLRLDVKPDSWRRSVTAKREVAEASEKKLAYLQFWTEFLPAFRTTHTDWKNRRKPVMEHWMGFASGRSEFSFNAAFRLVDGVHKLRAELYIDFGDSETNKEELGRLQRDRDEIEQVVGERLDWDPLDDSQASRISLYYADPIEVTERERWPDAQKWLIDALGRMRKAFGGKLTPADGHLRRPTQT